MNSSQELLQKDPTLAEQNMKRKDNSYLGKKIIIIGAGISGIGCAAKLLQYNFKNVQILEASFKIGGRIQTEFFLSKKKYDSHRIEFGMQRLNVPENSLLNVAAKEERQIDYSVPAYIEALEHLELGGYRDAELKVISDLRIYLSHLLLFPKDVRDVTRDQELLKIVECHDYELIRDFFRGTYRWWFLMSYEFMLCPIRNELKCGFDELLVAMVRHWKVGDKISPLKEVIRIDWTDFKDKTKSDEDPKIKISCQDETLYEADHVIICIPLGCLKESLGRLFDPPLPHEKSKAILSLDFVTVNKIFLLYDKPFWKKTDVYHVVWNTSLDEYFNNLNFEECREARGWIKFVNRFEYVPYDPKVLCAWIWGSGAERMEAVSTLVIGVACTRLLEYLTKKSLPFPNDVTRSQWKTNRFSRGSVVYDPSQGVGYLTSRIAEPVRDSSARPVLLFGSDAASPVEHTSTIDGAIVAGTNAADALVEYYCGSGSRMDLKW